MGFSRFSLVERSRTDHAAGELWPGNSPMPDGNAAPGPLLRHKSEWQHRCVAAIAPVEPIGWYFDHCLLRSSDGIELAITRYDLTRERIASLYAAAPEALRRNWPHAKASGWSDGRAAEAIIQACQAHGEFDPRWIGLDVEYRWPPGGGVEVIVRRPGATTEKEQQKWHSERGASLVH
jgi:hypothetical protein